jgi:hypothetical protein
MAMKRILILGANSASAVKIFLASCRTRQYSQKPTNIVYAPHLEGINLVHPINNNFLYLLSKFLLVSSVILFVTEQKVRISVSKE